MDVHPHATGWVASLCESFFVQCYINKIICLNLKPHDPPHFTLCGFIKKRPLLITFFLTVLIYYSICEKHNSGSLESVFNILQCIIAYNNEWY